MKNKLIKNKIGESFQFGLFIVLSTILISLFAFVSQENKITGFATFENNQEQIKLISLGLIEFKNINSLSTLAAGNYYVDSDGVVYWMDDESKPAIAKVDFVRDNQKNQHIYIDNEGRIGYVLNTIPINNNQ